MKARVYINSDFRTDGSNENFTIASSSLPFEAKTCQIVSATIPYTWDNVFEGENTFDLLEDGQPPEQITIETGFYSGEELAESLEDLLNAAGTGTYTIEYSGSQLVWTSDVEFQIANAEPLLERLLGFTGTFPENPELTFTTNSRIILDNEIFIAGDIIDGSDNGIIPWTQEELNFEDQYRYLARVPLICCHGSFINYLYQSDDVTNNKHKITSESPYNFYLSFISGAPIDLKGISWSFEMLLEA